MIMPRKLHHAVSPMITPVHVVFMCSLILSAIAAGMSTINRDGMLYVASAQAFLDGGFFAAAEFYSWPFLSIAIASVSWLTGLDLEASGYVLNAFFMAGACALTVACVIRQSPRLGWLSCLVVLALPGFNEYRNELLREFGCWFFIMLALWLALRWEHRATWTGAFAIQLALLAAALFRPEALALFATFIGWLLFSSPRGELIQRVVMLGALPSLVGAILLSLYLSGNLGSGRLAGEFGRINMERFEDKAQVLASGLIEYSRGNAQAILFFGSLALIPLKLIEQFGIFLIPLIFLMSTHRTKTTYRAYPLFAWAIAIYLLILVVFVTDMQFLAGRYVGPILLFSVPFIATGLSLFIDRWQRWRWVVVGMCILLALSNVISTSPGKVHFVEAGQWLATHAHESRSVYIDSQRAAYHAGWLNSAVVEPNRRDNIQRSVDTGSYELYVLELTREDHKYDVWMEGAGLRVIQRFGSRGTDEVLIAVPSRTP